MTKGAGFSVVLGNPMAKLYGSCSVSAKGSLYFVVCITHLFSEH